MPVQVIAWSDIYPTLHVTLRAHSLTPQTQFCWRSFSCRVVCSGVLKSCRSRIRNCWALCVNWAPTTSCRRQRTLTPS